MPILTITHELRPQTGGPFRSIPAMAAALVEAGETVHLITQQQPDTQLPTPCESAAGGKLTATAIPIAGGFDRWRVAALRREMTAWVAANPEGIVHVNTLWQPIVHVACAIAQKQRRPYLVTPRGMLEPWALNAKRWKKLAAWWAYQRRDLKAATILHATSDMEAANIARLDLGVPIAVIPNGLAVPAAVALAPAKTAARRTAIFLGRIHPVKRPLDLIHAWRELRPAGWKLQFVGDGADDFRAAIEREAQSVGDGAEIEFVGEVDDAEKWRRLAAADLLVLPSASENFGIVIAEALAIGVPVITTRGTPWHDLDRHGCGMCIEIGPAPLTAALRHMLALDPTELRAMGQRGRAWIARDFSWDRIVSHLRQIYAWMRHGGPLPTAPDGPPILPATHRTNQACADGGGNGESR